MSSTVSIIMTAYNAEKFLPKAMDSILAQTFTDFELILIDDASTDHTSEILADYAARDPRINLLTNEQNIGLTRSLNHGLAIAQGKYIARMDADDIAHPERLAQQINYLSEHPTIGLLGTAYSLIDEHGVEINRSHLTTQNLLIKWQMLYQNAFCHSSVMFRTEVLAALPQKTGYDESFRSSQDYELWDRMITCTTGANLPDYLLSWRLSEQQISKRKQNEQQANASKVSCRAINRLMGSDDFITLEEAVQLRSWEHAEVPKSPTPADFALADKWLCIWDAFAAKYHPNKVDQQTILHTLTYSLWLMVWTRQPGSIGLFWKLCKLAPLQLGRAILRTLRNYIILIRQRLGIIKRRLGINYKFFQ